MSARDPIQALWAAQPGESFTMSAEEIRKRASKLHSVVRRRNVVEYAAGAVGMVLFGAAAFFVSTPLAKVGCVLIAAGMAVVLWQLYRLARAASPDALAVTEHWAEFYRGELVRQRDALRSVWLWYLGPLVPGMVVFWLSAGIKTMDGDAALWGWLTTALGLGAMGLVFGAVVAANARAAKSLQAEIDALDAACEV